MLEKLITWSIKNKVIVIFMTVLLVGLGAQALFTTPVDAIPDLSDVQVIVYTESKGQ
jgi:copper/silver efflux system protein